jgi:glycogen operon protein
MITKLVFPANYVVSRGQCRPFGASVRAAGVNFAVFSRHARQVSLVLFMEGREEPLGEILLDPTVNKTGDVWHILVHNLPLDTLYGYRVDGEFTPEKGHRFNPKPVLLDPYARDLSGGHHWGVPDSPYGRDQGTLSRRSRIVLDDFDWEGDVPLATPLSRTLIYELHVRGFTRHPSSGVRHPGTFLGLCEKIPHLKALGVTAVQLMPVHEFDELEPGLPHPVTGERLKNYWGYSSLSFFAPKAAYAAEAGNQVNEFKQMVKTFHAEGIEVILDVVYNHTGEGNENGPTVNFRGLDNSIYYVLDRHGRYLNFSGCGNTLKCNHPVVRDLILESLVYWVSEMHVDGFRFDLASILGRGVNGEVLADPPLLRHIAENPQLAGTKLLAEAWDAAGLSQVGQFPTWGRWAEFNGYFRDEVRRFLRAEPGMTAHVARRICGSPDIYGPASTHPYHSINFITCHDGFTLCDLVSYNHKHNWANGEHNRDGSGDNISYNCGHEGPTADRDVNVLRQRQMRNFLTMLLLSQGVPFLTHGDEFGRTQQGNNNPYCQDNEISWVNWKLAESNAGLLRFARMMIALRKRYFSISREQFTGRTTWHGPRGEPDWSHPSRSLVFHLRGQSGQPDFFVIFNAHWETQRHQLPHYPGHWRRLVDTNLPAPHDMVEESEAVPVNPGDHYLVSPRSTVILLSHRR